MKKKYSGLAMTSTLAFLMLSTSAFAVNDADLLDGLDSTDFARATHAHSTSDVTGLDAELAAKADQTDVDAALAAKADQTYVDAELAAKADQTYVDAELAAKADQTYVDAELATKADQTYVDAELATKADQTDLDTAVASLEIADANPILPVNIVEPFTCQSANVGAIVLTSRFTTCVCNGADWVSTADGITSCEWAEGVVTSAGQVWMDRNLGASRVATSPTDSAAYGDLYQWGRGADGHQIRTSGTTSTLSTSDDPGHGDFITPSTYPPNLDWRSPQNDNLWQGVSGINNPCPAGFRLPNNTELETEMASWASQDEDGAFASPLKLTMAGLRCADAGSGCSGLPWYVGTHGDYWSSTVNGDQAGKMYFLDNYADRNDSRRAIGFSVRCIQD